MPHNPRLNKMIGLMEEGKPAFGTIVANGDLDGIRFAVEAGYDFVVIDNEHVGIDFRELRVSLQALVTRKKVASQGNLQADPTPLVRVSPNAVEVMANQWVLKHTLDHGAYGLILPRLESVEAAKAAVVACRYTQRAEAADVEPRGGRGWDPTVAAPYWGLTLQEYTEVADLWPLDPDGELLLMGLCETAAGVKNLPDILAEVRGIGVVWVAPGDLAVSMGVGPNPTDPRVEDAIMSVLKACQRHGVPCAAVARTTDELDRRMEQGFQVFFALHEIASPVLDHARVELRRLDGLPGGAA